MNNVPAPQDESSLRVFSLGVTVGKIQSLKRACLTVQVGIIGTTFGQRRLDFDGSVLPRLNATGKEDYFLKEIGVH